MDRDAVLQRFTEALQPFVPQGTAPTMARWVVHFNFDLRITGDRKSRFGDYHHPVNRERHLITVNGTLNRYAFLVTLLHEIAHLTTYEKHGHGVKPHGPEWKSEYRLLMTPFLELRIFPDGLHQALLRYIRNPKASSCSDDDLFRELKKLDQGKGNSIHLEELAEGSLFIFGKRRTFRKGERLKKRFRCVEIPGGHIYLFNPLAEVIPLEPAINFGLEN